MNCFIKFGHCSGGKICWNVVDETGAIISSDHKYEEAVCVAEKMEANGYSFTGIIIDQPILSTFNTKEELKRAMIMSALDESNIIALIEDTLNDVDTGSLIVGKKNTTFQKGSDLLMNPIIEDINMDNKVPGPDYPFTTISQMKKDRNLSGAIDRISKLLSKDFGETEAIPILSILDHCDFESAFRCLALYHKLSSFRSFMADCIYHALEQRETPSKQDALENLDRAYAIADGTAVFTIEEISGAMVKNQPNDLQEEIKNITNNIKVKIEDRDMVFDVLVRNESALLALPGILFVRPSWNVLVTMRSFLGLDQETEWQKAKLTEYLSRFVEPEEGSFQEV